MQDFKAHTVPVNLYNSQNLVKQPELREMFYDCFEVYLL